MSDSYWGKLSKERKEKQAEGKIPDFMTTAGYQLFLERYAENGEVKARYHTIAQTLSKHYKGTPFETQAEDKFFEMLWKGWLSPSTPVLANCGTNKGLPVSCSGNVVDDSIDGFYTARHEVAMLTKYGFGTSSYLGNIRPRGSSISVGGKAAGVVPVFKGFVQDMRDVSQGNTRRGAWAGYLPIDHGDFHELCDYLYNNPDDLNVGWVITDAFIEKLKNGDSEALLRYQKTLKTKMVTGRGYFCFIDKINRNRPEVYKKKGHFVAASNLCDEITLFSDRDNTFSCVLSSLNISKYDEWKDTDTIFWAVLFLDAVASEMIEQARGVRGLEKVVHFTEYSRALGLGQCGWATYLQKKMIPFESLEAHWFNMDLAEKIHKEANKASEALAQVLGEPELMKGTGKRNSHLIAIAPTKSTALIMGGISEGISPDPAMSYMQNTAGGSMDRLNPVFLELMKKRGKYNPKEVQKIAKAVGSVQGLEWLSEDEKKVFRTAFEIDQKVILRYASMRAKWVDQWQSLNLFFPADCEESLISSVHQQAFMDERILGLYYIYTMAGVQGSTGECMACQ